MLGLIAKGVTALKERALEAILKGLINRKIKPFGSVTRLQIDSRQKTASAQLALKGEPQPTEIRIGSYALVEEDGVTYISVHNLEASKEWLSVVLNEYVAGRKFKVPFRRGGS